MKLTIIIMSIMFVALVFIVFMLLKALQHRKKSFFTVPVRPVIKILSLLSGLFVASLITFLHFPDNLIFLGFILTVILSIFSIDIIVDPAGIHCGINFTPWESIINIENHSLYIMIVTKNKVRKKGYLKAIWKIEDSHIKEIRGILKNKGEK